MKKKPQKIIEIIKKSVWFISVPGQWSNWSNWSECSATCGRGIRKRTRICNNPAPINNGPGCEGLAVEKKSCNQVCPAVDGKWTSWSSWSSCSSDCQQFRRRLCNNPKPSNGGRYCLGDDIAKQNCTGGMCKRKLYIQINYPLVLVYIRILSKLVFSYANAWKMKLIFVKIWSLYSSVYCWNFKFLRFFSKNYFL